MIQSTWWSKIKYLCLIMDSVSTIFHTVGEMELHSKQKPEFWSQPKIVPLQSKIWSFCLSLKYLFVNKLLEIVQFYSVTRMTIGWRAENKRQRQRESGHHSICHCQPLHSTKLQGKVLLPPFTFLSERAAHVS